MGKKTLEQLNAERNELCTEKERSERMCGVYAAQVKSIDAKIEALKANQAALENLICEGSAKQKTLETKILELSEQIATYK